MSLCLSVDNLLVKDPELDDRDFWTSTVMHVLRLLKWVTEFGIYWERLQNCEKKATVNFAVSVRSSVRLEQFDSHWTFSLNLILIFFFWNCRVNSSFVKTWQEWRVLYMKTYVYLRYLAQLIHTVRNSTLYVPCIILQCVNVTLYVPCIIL